MVIMSFIVVVVMDKLSCQSSYVVLTLLTEVIIMITREVKVLALVALVVLDNMNVFIVEMADVIVAMIMVVIVVVKMQLYLNNKICSAYINLL
ncbi:hypothetical protein DPMN_151050 [Dreissena polymorpha]|uniref:Uncharacterized protein n=1 Tax=Dreissena polymorpha TaxID=45954 RepID=A0A9D4FED3_DREPO|nr:hypothetical protein DPMN_151050 [Dreissena polymorpha]